MTKKAFLCGIILCTMILNGCAQWFLGDGRGDIKIPLKDEYYIFEVNSTCIDFCKKSPEGSYHRVIDRYFVTMFYVSDFYICLGGIHTESWSISEQERKHGSTAYYLYNTDTGDLDGPYWDLNVFESCCNTKDFSVENNWLFVRDYQ